MAERCHKIARNRPRDKIRKMWRASNIQGCRLFLETLRKEEGQEVFRAAHFFIYYPDRLSARR